MKHRQNGINGSVLQTKEPLFAHTQSDNQVNMNGIKTLKQVSFALNR